MRKRGWVGVSVSWGGGLGPGGLEPDAARADGSTWLSPSSSVFRLPGCSPPEGRKDTSPVGSPSPRPRQRGRSVKVGQGSLKLNKSRGRGEPRQKEQDPAKIRANLRAQLSVGARHRDQGGVGAPVDRRASSARHTQDQLR